MITYRTIGLFSFVCMQPHLLLSSMVARPSMTDRMSAIRELHVRPSAVANSRLSIEWQRWKKRKKIPSQIKAENPTSTQLRVLNNCIVRVTDKQLLNCVRQKEPFCMLYVSCKHGKYESKINARLATVKGKVRQNETTIF